MSLVLEYLKQKATYIIPIISWYYFGNMICYYNQYNFKVARNIISAIHALSVISLYSLNVNIMLMYLISRGYYTVDTAYEVADLKRANSIKLYQLGMLLHHFVTLYGLQYMINPLTSYYVTYTFFLAEVSNLPLYLMRHLRSKGYYNKYLIKGITFLEFVAYFVLRICMCIPIIYNVFIYSNVDIYLKCMTITMYLISGFWTYKMFGQLIR